MSLVCVVLALLATGCVSTYRYSYDWRQVEVSDIQQARELLLSATYREVARSVDLNDMLYSIHEATGIAIEYRGTWRPRYNKRFEFDDLGGQSCRDALDAIWALYKLRPDFRAGKIHLVRERTAKTGPIPRLLE
jgi:hypothetical protein